MVQFNDHIALDKLEINEMVHSRLRVRSLMIKDFYNKTMIQYSHINHFEEIPLSCLLIMVLKAHNGAGLMT
jgi:hypothetical protein